MRGVTASADFRSNARTRLMRPSGKAETLLSHGIQNRKILNEGEK